MKTARKLPVVTKCFYRAEQRECPQCHQRLRRAVTLSERTIITLDGVFKIVHAGYRCPNQECAAHRRTYRSVAADALALPGFTFGLDLVLLVGQLHLGQHQTVDEVHHLVLESLAKHHVTISRREILYLFEAYCTLLRASSQAKDDQEWLAEAREEWRDHRLH